jgi:hypothetical protein
VRGDMFGFIAFDFVLRLAFAGAMSVAFVIEITGVDFGDMTANVPGFAVPGHVIANLE